MGGGGAGDASVASARQSLREASTRDASNRLLAVLRDGSWSPSAWARFAALTALRSIDTARANPRALAQSTAIHLPFLWAAPPRRRPWVMTSWLLTITHLGMIGDTDTLGVPNTLTLIRANLPAVEARLGAALPVLSLLTDFADGRIARATGQVTAFGAQADFIADAAFWTWFVMRYDPSRLARIATVAAWVMPVVGLAVTGAVRGRITDLPRSAWLRPAAVLEVIIGGRAIVRLLQATHR